jgi:hypothetical protein
LGTKRASFGMFRARFVVAISSAPTFSQGWGILRSSFPQSRMAPVLYGQKCRLKLPLSDRPDLHVVVDRNAVEWISEGTSR